ncbi:MAG: tetratricopeptide repeat protein [Planctomycetota bacterium]|nr:tetratricopeptide repeat protein [Planctomycetota bacterium]
MGALVFRILILMLSLWLVPAGNPTAVAAPRGGGKKSRISRQKEGKAYSLDDILKEPRNYLEREVFFYCRFASTANLFKNINTRFNSNEHANFAVWPDKTILWEEKARKTLLPTLYVAKNQTELVEALRTAEKYELLAITGVVMNVYANYPWIFVTKIEKVELEGDKVSDVAIEHMQNGVESLAAGSGGVAARHIEQALQTGLPPEYRSAAYEKAARAYLMDDRLDKARDYLRMAVESKPDDADLNLALADVTLRMGDAAEALAHCEFALEGSGRHPQVYGIMGEARSHLGEYAKAFADLNAAAGTPGITPRERAMVNVRRARIYLRSGRAPDAARVFAAVSQPGDPLAGESWLHTEIGIFYERLFLEGGPGSYLDSAAMSYEEAARLARLDPMPLYSLAEVEIRGVKVTGSSSYDKVRAILERIAKIEPDFVPAKIIEGRILFAEGKPNEAESRYQMVAAQIGDDAVSLMALAEAYLELGRPEDAAGALRRARRLAPWNGRVANVGLALEKRAIAAAGNNGLENDPSGPQRLYPEGGADTRRTSIDRRVRQAGRFASTGGYHGDSGASFAGAMPTQKQQENEARRITIRPGERVRVGRDGAVRLEKRGTVRDDLQAIVQPAPLPNRPSYPVTGVRLPEAIGGREKRRAPESREPAGGDFAAPLDLGYNPGSGNMLEPAWPEAENEWDAPGDIEAEKRHENWPEDQEDVWGFEIFKSEEPVSMVGNRGEGAYASIPAGVGGSGFKIPSGHSALPAFSFAPDASPILIAWMRSSAGMLDRPPIRNANLFRPVPGGGRQPAEIIEKEPAPSPAVPDYSGMTPPNGPATPRTEVCLPSSSLGVGMASDYIP